jgi:hypothetical protein
MSAPPDYQQEVWQIGQPGVILNIKWRCSSRYVAQPRRFCRRDMLIRFPVRQSFLSGLASSAQGSHDISWVMPLIDRLADMPRQRPPGAGAASPDNFQNDSHAARRLPANV